MSGQAQEEAGDEQGQASQQEQPAQSYPIPFPIEIIEDQAAADARERREAESRQNEIDDLVAQQGMNAATKAMNAATEDMRDYAFYSTIFVGIGTLLLFFTLWLSLKSNKAARDMVNLMRAEQRPWVDFKLNGFDKLYTTKRHVSVARIEVENIGNSIAFDAEIRTIFYEGAEGADFRVSAELTDRFDNMPEHKVGTDAMHDSHDKRRFFSFMPNSCDTYKAGVLFPPEFYNSDRMTPVGDVYLAICIRYKDFPRKESCFTVKHFRIKPDTAFVFVGKGAVIEDAKIIGHPNRSVYR